MSCGVTFKFRAFNANYSKKRSWATSLLFQESSGPELADESVKLKEFAIESRLVAITRSILQFQKIQNLLSPARPFKRGNADSQLFHKTGRKQRAPPPLPPGGTRRNSTADAAENQSRQPPIKNRITATIIFQIWQRCTCHSPHLERKRHFSGEKWIKRLSDATLFDWTKFVEICKSSTM